MIVHLSNLRFKIDVCFVSLLKPNPLPGADRREYCLPIIVLIYKFNYSRFRNHHQKPKEV